MIPEWQEVRRHLSALEADLYRFKNSLALLEAAINRESDNATATEDSEFIVGRYSDGRLVTRTTGATGGRVTICDGSGED